MKTVSISELRANLLQYLSQVQRGERIEVTSKGAVLATLVPPVGEREVARARLEELAAGATVGDVITPIGDDWEAAEELSQALAMALGELRTAEDRWLDLGTRHG